GIDHAHLLGVARHAVEQAVVPSVFPAMREQIDCHHRLGDATYIVTAAPREVAELIAGHLGMTGAFGTVAVVDDEGVLAGELGADVVGGPLKGEVVRRAAVAHGHTLRFSSAYGDSVRDLPMLEAVGFPQAVNPDRHLRRIAVDRGWPILHT